MLSNKVAYGKANSISKMHTLLFWQRDFKELPSNLQDYITYLKSEGWNISVTTQTRGWCKYWEKQITLPTWIFTTAHKESGKFVWYIAHECSHAKEFLQDGVSPGNTHGQKFMSCLKSLCPVEFLHWELGYKPRNAAKAGIEVNLPKAE